MPIAELLGVQIDMQLLLKLSLSTAVVLLVSWAYRFYSTRGQGKTQLCVRDVPERRPSGEEPGQQPTDGTCRGCKTPLRRRSSPREDPDKLAERHGPVEDNSVTDSPTPDNISEQTAGVHENSTTGITNAKDKDVSNTSSEDPGICIERTEIFPTTARGEVSRENPDIDGKQSGPTDSLIYDDDDICQNTAETQLCQTESFTAGITNGKGEDIFNTSSVESGICIDRTEIFPCTTPEEEVTRENPDEDAAEQHEPVQINSIPDSVTPDDICENTAEVQLYQAGNSTTGITNAEDTSDTSSVDSAIYIVKAEISPWTTQEELTVEDPDKDGKQQGLVEINSIADSLTLAPDNTCENFTAGITNTKDISNNTSGVDSNICTESSEFFPCTSQEEVTREDRDKDGEQDGPVEINSLPDSLTVAPDNICEDIAEVQLWETENFTAGITNAEDISDTSSVDSSNCIESSEISLCTTQEDVTIENPDKDGKQPGPVEINSVPKSLTSTPDNTCESTAEVQPGQTEDFTVGITNAEYISNNTCSVDSGICIERTDIFPCTTQEELTREYRDKDSEQYGPVEINSLSASLTVAPDNIFEDIAEVQLWQAENASAGITNVGGEDVSNTPDKDGKQPGPDSLINDNGVALGQYERQPASDFQPGEFTGPGSSLTDKYSSSSRPIIIDLVLERRSAEEDPIFQAGCEQSHTVRPARLLRKESYLIATEEHSELPSPVLTQRDSTPGDESFTFASATSVFGLPSDSKHTEEEPIFLAGCEQRHSARRALLRKESYLIAIEEHCEFPSPDLTQTDSTPSDESLTISSASSVVSLPSESKSNEPSLHTSDSLIYENDNICENTAEVQLCQTENSTSGITNAGGENISNTPSADSGICIERTETIPWTRQEEVNREDPDKDGERHGPMQVNSFPDSETADNICENTAEVQPYQTKNSTAGITNVEDISNTSSADPGVCADRTEILPWTTTQEEETCLHLTVNHESTLNPPSPRESRAASPTGRRSPLCLQRLDGSVGVGRELWKDTEHQGGFSRFLSKAAITVEDANLVLEERGGCKTVHGKIYDTYVESSSHSVALGQRQQASDSQPGEFTGRGSTLTEKYPSSPKPIIIHDLVLPRRSPEEDPIFLAGSERRHTARPALLRKESYLIAAEHSELPCPVLTQRDSTPSVQSLTYASSSSMFSLPPDCNRSELSLHTVASAQFFHTPGNHLGGADIESLKGKLDLGNCMEVLALAKKQGNASLYEAALQVMSDNYLHVLRDPTLYGRLLAGEREKIQKQRMKGRRFVVVADMDPQGWSKGAVGPRRLVPGTEQGSGSSSGLFYYDDYEDAWHQLCPIPQEVISKGCAMCTMDNYLFVTLGFECTSEGEMVPSKRVFCYNPATSIWKEICPMNEARPHCKLVALQDYVYAIGGECLSSVERYEPRTDRWTHVAPLPNDTFAVAHRATACNGELFVSGGTLRYTLLRYNPKSNAWKPSRLVGSKGRTTEMVAVRSFLYRFEVNPLLGVSVYRYHTAVRVWYECSTRRMHWCPAFQCVAMDDSIYCVSRQFTIRFNADEVSPAFVAEDLSVLSAAKGILFPFVLSLPDKKLLQTSV